MNAYDFYLTPHAADTFRSIVSNMQEVSLIAAERVRSRIVHRLHLIHHNPMQASRKMELSGLDGHFRVADVLNYKMVYLVKENRIVLMDILLDKEMSKV
ncbi:MAG: hypothetical protein ACK5XV_13015 [Flavobacteriales bacterium]|jgi:hypothetical protein